MKQPEEQKFCGCRGTLHSIIIPIFGDFNLGVADEFWQCQRCGKRVEVDKLPRQETR